ncbi:MAG TPA: FCD domain-containing protein, partial [Ktedonobacteraceae bacterium]|nr:FCD domain-containing protein [Ktedonobacteraceae bacterium]
SLAYNRLYASNGVPKNAEHLDREHRAILAACQANDPAAAADAVRQHIQQTIAHVKQLIEQVEKA